MDADTKRELEDLRLGSIQTVGTFDLSTTSTSTLISRRACSSGSVVVPSPYSSTATLSDIKNIVPAKGSFTVNHTASATARTFRYVFFTGPDII